jgi:methyltransferase
MITFVALAIVLLMMLIELQISRVNERRLRERGAIQPPDPIYKTMRWAYPGTFVMMAIEGAVMPVLQRPFLVFGIVVFVAAKLLKAWAIRSLGDRWTYTIFVVPGAPLVNSGPYRWFRHPNYLGVAGELVGFALVVSARLTGPVALLVFGELLRRRIRAEEQALGLRQLR